MRIAIVDDERPARSELRHQIQELLKEAEIVEGDSGAAAYSLQETESMNCSFSISTWEIYQVPYL